VLGGAADIFVFRPGRQKPEFACDATFVGDYVPGVCDPIEALCRTELGLDVKIFGEGWSVPQCLGRIQESELSDLYASAMASIHVEDGNLDRPFSILAVGGCVVSPVPESIESLRDRSFRTKMIVENARFVLADETYFERTVELFEALGLKSLIPGIIQAKSDTINRRVVQS
jgi:hypothetical protein